MKKLGLLVVFLLYLSTQAFSQQTLDPRVLPPGVPRQMQVDGTNITGNDPVNIQESAELDPVNTSAGNIQWSIKANSIADTKLQAITNRAKLPSTLAYEDEANTYTQTQTFGGTVAINGSGLFTIAGSTSGLITFNRSAAAGIYNWNYPTSAGTAGQPLLSGGGGATPMSFGTLGLGAGGTNRSTAWTGDRCVRVNTAGTALEPAAADCGAGGGGGGHVIYDVSGLFSQRSKLRFLGAPVSIADNAGNDSTDVTIAAAVVNQAGNYVWTGTNSWRDNNFTILGSADQTKGIRFEVDGLPVSTIYTYTTPLANTNLLGGSDLGNSVQAYSAKLAAISGLTWAADNIMYATSASAASQFASTSFSRGLLAGVDAAAWRTSLGLVIGTNVQGFNARLAELAALTPTANRLLGSNATNFVYHTVPSTACDPIRY